MKTAIVTGASGNLGQSVVNKFLAQGYRVIGTVNHNEPAKINLNNPNFEEEAVDLIDESKAKEFVDRVISKYKTIDVAVLTVGGFAAGKITETGTAEVMKQYRLNFETAYNVARPSFVQMMQQDNGRIFIIGSRPGLDAKYGKGMVAYGLAKSLIFRLAELMNDEAKGHNVVTSVVVPSTIDTPQNRKAMPDANFDSWVKPEAIADVIYFHCTPEGSVLREPLIKVYGNA
jgi:NAD(P)-dependent dehydrogenase (short-subunit alcohol dehydrogenase family)